jgi:acetyl esterase/lipase
MGARRALTFLERQPQVDAERLGVYGHSMGGKLTVMTTAADKRVKAAAPSCGGISDRVSDSALYRATIGDAAQLPNIHCPITFLSPANDFHGHINDLPKAVKEMPSKTWRVTCAPHHNHQDTDPYEVATPLWFDEHLKGTFKWPATPTTSLKLDSGTAVPLFSVRPDTSKPVKSVNIYYTQQGVDTGARNLHTNRINRHWHHAKAVRNGNAWFAHIHVFSTDKPLWVYANVEYTIDKPVSGAGYYYRLYNSKSFNVSSMLAITSSDQLKAAGVKATLKPTQLIEAFQPGWQQEWFTYRHAPDGWRQNTHKLYHDMYKAPPHARLVLNVTAPAGKKLVLGLDKYAAELPLGGGHENRTIYLEPSDFLDVDKKPLPGWDGLRELRITDTETLRDGQKTRKVGAPWQGPGPKLHSLSWSTNERAAAGWSKPDLKLKPSANAQEPASATFTYRRVKRLNLAMKVWYPAGWKPGGKPLPAAVMFFGGGWHSGDISQFDGIGPHLAKQGMIVVAPQYRTGQQKVQPNICLEDAKSAMRYVYTHAAELGIDSKMIAAGGRSAGGHLAAATAFARGFDAEGDDTSIPTRPAALVLYNPVIDNGPGGFRHDSVKAYWQNFSPLHTIGKNPPPTIFITGDKDQYTPIETAEKYKAEMEKHGGRCELVVHKGGVHGSPFHPSFYDTTFSRIDAFLASLGYVAGK